MKRYIDFFSIIGLMSLLIKMTIDKQLSVEMGAILLIGAIFVFAKGGWISTFLKIAIGFLGVAYFFVGYAYSMKEFLAIAASFGALLIALFGFFVMFGGLSSRDDEITVSINRRTGKIKKR